MENAALAAQTMIKPAEGDQSSKRHRWILRVMETEGPHILALLRRLLSNEADVLDAYQDCFCKLATFPGRHGISSVRAYIYRTASNIGIEIIRTRARRSGHLRKIAAQQGNLVDEPGPSDPDDAELDILREAIADLPAHLRNVIHLRDFCGFSYKELAAILNIDPATARVYRRHAIVKLSSVLPREADV
ncbi:MAG: RNA polymerase sigma factor [Phycisphaerae bacterium]